MNAALQAELDQLMAKRKELETPLNNASDVITALDTKTKDQNQDNPTKAELAVAKETYLEAWKAWDAVDKEVHAKTLMLQGIEAGPDQSIGG